MTEFVVGVVIVVGLAGIVVPVMPGSILILAAVLVWAIVEGSITAWMVFSLAVAFLAVGAIVKYTIPGRQLKVIGVPNRSLVLGGVLAIVGFFVIPVVGLIVGFVLGVYLAERHRVGQSLAWTSTTSALKAVGVSIMIELAAALLASSIWLAGAIVT